MNQQEVFVKHFGPGGNDNKFILKLCMYKREINMKHVQIMHVQSNEVTWGTYCHHYKVNELADITQ